jgi:hypothetical protein
MARQFSRWTGVPFIGLRLSNVIVHEEYPRRRERAVLAGRRRAGRRPVHHRRRDTVMQRPSRELMQEVFPGVAVPEGLPEHGTLLSSDKARRVLGNV